MLPKSEKKIKRKSKELRVPIIFIKNNLKKDLIGLEVGVKHGTHAEQILSYLPLKKLFLIDIWESWYLKVNEKLQKQIEKKSFILK